MAKRPLGKSNKLVNVRYDIRGPVNDEAQRMEANGIDVLKMNIGNPAAYDLRAPDEIVVDMIYNLRDSEGYSVSKGLFSARKAIMQYCQNKRIPDVGMEDIYTGNGVSELINISMEAMLNDGDEVLVPMPDYPLWTASIVLAGGKAVHYRCVEENNWYPDLEDMRKKVTDRTKAIVVINPNNPTGVLYPVEILKGIVDIARENGLVICADEIYDRLVMDGKEHVALASLAPDLLVLCYNGLSKSHRVAGFRSGWLCLAGDKSGAEEYISGLNLLASLRLCSNVPGQSIIQTAIGGYQSSSELVAPGGRLYEQRQFIWSALNSIPGVSAVKPDAAFYIFPKIDTGMYRIENDDDMAMDMLHEVKMLVTTGTALNWDKPDHLRFVYLARIAVLEEAMNRFETYLKTIRRKGPVKK